MRTVPISGEELRRARLVCLFVATYLAGCSQQSVAPVDVAALADVAEAETLEDAEFDGTDSVPDAIADSTAATSDAPGDVPDAADNSQDCAASPADAASYDPADVPYWIANDVDVSGLGVRMECGPCADPLFQTLQVLPNDLPYGPTCTSFCPAPYACTCGACPWIGTPPMHIPRVAAKAVWAGEEVQIFGTWNMDPQGAVINFSIERWNPSKDKGFSFIDLPFAITYTDSVWDLGGVLPLWTGAETLVLMDKHQFTIDPKTHAVTELPLAPALAGNFGAAVWTGDRAFWWGWDRALDKPGKAFPRIVTWQKTSGWTDVAFPTAYLQPTAIEPDCMATLDGDVYVFDPANPRAANSGLDPGKPVMLRYSVNSGTWDALPQTMAVDVRCNKAGDGQILFQAFPDGIAFIPPISPGATPAEPPVGEIWWKASGTWTAMQPPPLVGPFTPTSALWTGKEFLIPEVSFIDPVLLNDGKSYKDWGISTWPIRYDPYTDTFKYLTSVGYPKHDRGASAFAFTGSEILMFGGANGINVNTYHNEGYRLWFPNP